MPLQVQRLRSPESGLRSFTVVDGRGAPVWPVEEFLAHLVAGRKAPNTVEAYAHDVQDLCEWHGQRGWNFRELSLEQQSTLAPKRVGSGVALPVPPSPGRARARAAE